MTLGLLAPRFASHFDGVGDHAARIAAALARDGYDVVVFTETPAACPGCEVVAVGTWDAAAAGAVLRAARERALAAAFVEYTPFNFGARTLAPHALAAALRARGVAVGTFVHEGFYRANGTNPMHPLRAALLGMRDAALVAASHAVFSASEARRAPLVAAVPWAARRIHVVPIGANVEPPADWHWAPPVNEPLRLVSFGVVVPRRRLELWIEALALAESRGLALELTVVGRVYDEVYAERCAALARERGVAERLRFARDRAPHEVTAAFGAAHLAVTALYEGAIASSGSLLAVLAHGIPLLAVATPRDEPAFDDVVRFAEPEPAELLRAVLDIVRAPDGGVARGRRARAFYERTFGWDRIARDSLDATLSAASKRAKP